MLNESEGGVIMALRISEQNLINKNIERRFEREQQSGLLRWQETTPIFVNYFHLDNERSTTDSGFMDVAELIGPRSPMRFQKIENLPLYNFDQIVLQLQDEEQGLDSNYESEAIIIPTTIKPVQNSYFTIPSLPAPYLFRVTSIQYDNVMPDNYSRISFVLDYLDEDKIEELERQVVKNNICIYENIGTDKKCIIEKGNFIKIHELEKMMEDMKEAYIAMFYSERYNVFLGNLEDGYNKTIYDPYQTKFINKHNIFNMENDYHTLLLTDQIDDPKIRLKYEKSVYRFIENPDIDRLNEFIFVYSSGITYAESAFYRWRDPHVQVVDIIEHLPNRTLNIFSKEFVDDVVNNRDMKTSYALLLKKYIRKETLTLEDIPENIADELLYLNNSLEVFFITPILMYIMKKIISGVE